MLLRKLLIDIFVTLIIIICNTNMKKIKQYKDAASFNEMRELAKHPDSKALECFRDNVEIRYQQAYNLK